MLQARGFRRAFISSRVLSLSLVILNDNDNNNNFISPFIQIKIARKERPAACQSVSIAAARLASLASQPNGWPSSEPAISFGRLY